MANSPLTQELFKFVCLRAPKQSKPGISSERQFLLVDIDRAASVVYAAITDAETKRATKIKIARDYISSNDFIGRIADIDLDNRLRILSIIDLLKKERPNETAGELGALVTKAASLSHVAPSKSTDSFLSTTTTSATPQDPRMISEQEWVKKLTRSVWDSIYAALYLCQEARINVSELTSVLRAFAILRHWPSDSATRIQHLCMLNNLQLRVPKELFSAPARYYKEEETREDAWKLDEVQTAKKKQLLHKQIEGLLQAHRLLNDLLTGGVNATTTEKDIQFQAEPRSSWFFKLGKDTHPPLSAETIMSEPCFSIFSIGKVWGAFDGLTRDLLMTAGLHEKSDAVQVTIFINRMVSDLFSALAAVSSFKEVLNYSSELTKHHHEGKKVANDVLVEGVKTDSIQSPAKPPNNPPSMDTCDFSGISMPVGCVRPIGVGDLNIVEQTLIKYEAGEIADIQNILQGETRSRTHRRLDKTESTIFQSSERTAEKLENLKTSERFEMSRESEQVLQSRMTAEGGLTVSGSYGSVNFSANAQAAYESSSQSTTRQAVQYAKEITDEATNRVEERVREDKTLVTIREIEETNVHSLTNDKGEAHISGAYFWVNKKYCAQVRNYGKRLFMEFVIPEPASFYRYVFSSGEIQGINLDPPEDPGDLSPDDIHWFDYKSLAAKYGAQNIAPPPEEWKYVGKSFVFPPEGAPPESESVWHTKADKFSKEELTEGYLVCQAAINPKFQVRNWFDVFNVWYTAMWVGVGGNLFFDWYYEADTITRRQHLGWSSISSRELEWPEIPIYILAENLKYAAVNISLLLHRADSTYQQWQINTWKEIINAYQLRKVEYDEAVRTAKIAQGGQISGQNPLGNRQIEKTELQRQSIHLLTSWNFLGFGSVMQSVPPHGYPEMETRLALWNARIVQFFEQAFEWNQMTYIFYPYFWARKSAWPELLKQKDTDAIFQKFLQSGSARVLVPVRPGYEGPIEFYLRSGRLWNGDDTPIIGDEMYVSMIDEFVEEYGLLASIPVGPPWLITVPTSLVTLRPDLLPSWETQVTCDDESVSQYPELDLGSAAAAIYGGLAVEVKANP